MINEDDVREQMRALVKWCSPTRDVAAKQYVTKTKRFLRMFTVSLRSLLCDAF